MLPLIIREEVYPSVFGQHLWDSAENPGPLKAHHLQSCWFFLEKDNSSPDTNF